MSVKISSSGEVTQLDKSAEPDDVVTEEDVQDPARLSRLILADKRAIAKLNRRWAPRYVDFEDVTVDAVGTLFTLRHGLGGRVRFWVVDFRVVGAAGAPIIQRDATETTNDVLGLRSYKEAEVTIRVEEVG